MTNLEFFAAFGLMPIEALVAAAIVLYFLAVGSVRGFALTLGLSTALDLFVSRLFMHPSVWLLAQTKRFNESKTLGMGSVAGVGELVPAAGGVR